MWKALKKDLNHNWLMYIMILPVLVYFIVFHYIPMYGITIAFKDFNVKQGILGSPWVGFENFGRFFSSYNFEMLMKNTLGISLYSLVVEFPLPIVFALLLHYLKNKPLKKVVQMISYAPHFLSTVVICSMLILFCNEDSGIFNIVGQFFGMKPVNWLAKPEWFKSIYVWSGLWQGMGWSAVIYLSALSGVDYEMHEAAIVDGASIIQRMRYIDIPSISPTIVMLLILRLGSIMGVGFEKVYLMQNSLNYRASQVISTYVYEVGLIQGDYSFSTAAGLFNTVINGILIISANNFSKRVLKESLW